MIAILGALLLLAGCGDLLSLHGLYTAQDNVTDPALEGKWEDKDDWILVEREAGFYLVTIQSKKDYSASSKYEMRLVDIGGVRFADLLPFDSIGHMFLKVSVKGEQLRISFFDSQWLRKQIPHDLTDLPNHKKQAVLTAQTPELRTLVAKYAAEPKAYDEEVIFVRSK